MNANGADRRQALPELRAARAHARPGSGTRRRSRRRRRSRCRRSSPGRPAEARARCRSSAELSEQPLHAARRALPACSVTESQTRLCPLEALQAQGAEHGVAALVALLGRADRVPAPDRAAGARGPAARDRRVVGQLRLELAEAELDAARARAAEGEPAHLLHRARAGLQSLRRVVPAPGTGTADALLPARPDAARRRGSTSRTAACARWRRRTRPAATASSGGTGSSRCRRGSGTCCRSATRTSCSGTFLSTGCTRPGLWDKALVVVTADHGDQLPRRRPAPRPDEDEPRRPRVHPALREAPRSEDRAASSTRTSRPRTSSRRSPTCSASRSRGRRTAARC